MKKLTKALILTLCAAMLLTLVTGCGSEEKGAESDATLNAYTASYEDVVAMLKKQGVIKDTENAVDMNAVGGYWDDNMNGGLAADPVVGCDIAKDFGGVYLVWFDVDGNYFADWVNMKINSGFMVYEGGMYTLGLDSYRGMFGLGFGADVPEETKTAARAAFDTLDTAAPESVKYLTSASELALLLKGKGYLEGKDIAGYEDLNSKYYVEGPGEDWSEEANDYVAVDNYKYYAVFGTDAMTYGGITIFYFNTADGYTYLEENLDYTGYGLAYKGLLADNKIVAYVGDADYVYTPYLENGQEIAYTADVVCGRFAVSIDDGIANKAEIVEYIQSLGN